MSTGSASLGHATTDAVCFGKKRSILFIGTWVGIVLELFLNDGHSGCGDCLRKGRFTLAGFRVSAHHGESISVHCGRNMTHRITLTHC